MYKLVKIDANGTPINKEYKNKSDDQELDRLSEKSTRPHSPDTVSNCANPATQSYIYDINENQYYLYVRDDKLLPIYKKVDAVINSKFKSLKENIALFNKNKELFQKPNHNTRTGDQLSLNDTIISSIETIKSLINSSENQETLFEILNSIRAKFTVLQCV